MTQALRNAFERLVASDPGWGRLRTAAWALLTAAAATGLLLGAAHLLDLPQALPLAGVVVGLVSTVIVQDATSAAQQGTLAAAAVVASAVMVVASALAGSFVASGAGFVAVTMAGFAVQRFGTRGRALGAMAYQSYFYALLLHPPLALWPWLPASVAAGCAVAWIVRFRLLPERAPAVLAHELAALRACVLVLLRQVADALDAPHKRRQERRTAATLRRLNDLSLRLEQRVARFASGDGDDGRAQRVPLRDRVLRAELAAETLQACSASARDDPRVSQAARAQLAQRLRRVAQALRDGAALDGPPAGGQALDPDRQWRFARAVQTLLQDPPWRGPLPSVADSTAPAAPPAQPRPAPHASPWHWLADEATRRALQAGAAALAAMLVGHAISEEHWYWAVFGALVVFTQAGTRGQALAGVWRRMLASVAGLALGLAVADWVHGQPVTQFALLFVFVAIGFYAFQAFQPAYIAILTAMLAMLYELIGKYSPGLLLLRLEETAAGAAAALLSALLVLPAHTREQSDEACIELLRKAAGLLRAAVAGDDPRAPVDAVRDLDRRLQALRQALGPVTTPDAPTSKGMHRRRLHLAAVVVYSLRHFANLLAGYAGEHRERLTAPARRLAEQLEAVADGLANAGAMPAVPRMHEEPDEAPADDADEADLLRIALHWLAEAGDALRAIGDEGSASAAPPPDHAAGA